MIIRYNKIKNRIEEKNEIDRLRDFQFWYMQITNNETNIERLKDFWLKEIAKSKLETADKGKLNDLREE
ncbi:6732_t:CDS:2, partial [Cetraspora pellucida]